MISIFFGYLPGNVKTLMVKDGTTLGELLSDKNVCLDNAFEVRVAGQKKHNNYVLQPGESVLIVAPILGERTIKRNGVWRIHKYDLDTNWPSDLHGHNQNDSEVLDLYTGDIFNPRTHTFVRKLPKSDLEYIRAQLL